MRKYILILFLLPLISCNDWLDVSPKSEKRQDELFDTESGFKSALIGAYIGAADSSLYGRNTSVLLPESFLRNWVVPASVPGNSSYHAILLNYNILNLMFEEPRMDKFIEIVWNKYYNVILTLNNVLEHIGNSGAAFQFGNDKLIEGEALGLRAFLHLDILRFFGPVPTLAGNGSYIPYVDIVTRDPNQLVSLPYNTILEKILADLNKAEELLEETDPILNYPMAVLRSEVAGETPDDDWQLNRQIRFNYYAVLAAKARYYLWTGDKTNAAKYAKMVIDAKEEDGSKKFPLATETYIQGSAGGTQANPLTLPVEHIFAFQNSKHYTSVMEPLLVASLADGVVMRKPVTEVETLFEKGMSPDDIRIRPNRYWKEVSLSNTSANIFLKYGGPDEKESPGLIPAMRIAEMYLIMIECSGFDAARQYFSEYRIARNMNSVVMDDFTQDSLMDRLEKEYYKEFYGEGQMFHFYKRLNITEFSWPYTREIKSTDYIIPKPIGQIKFE